MISMLYGERGGQVAVGRQIVERGDELAPREVAGRAEDDDDTGVRHRAVDQVVTERVVGGGFGHDENQAAERSSERAKVMAEAERLRM